MSVGGRGEMEGGPLREATLSGSPAQKRVNRPQPQAGSISPLPHRPGPHSQVGDSQRGHPRPSSPPRYEAAIRSPHPTPALAPRRRSAPRHPFSASIQPRQPRSAGFQKAPCTPTPSPLGPPPSTAPTDGPPTPPGLDLSPKAQRSQALATQATNPPKMHLRPPRPAACHGHGRGHPRGRPSAVCAGARGGCGGRGRDSHAPPPARARARERRVRTWSRNCSVASRSGRRAEPPARAPPDPPPPRAPPPAAGDRANVRCGRAPPRRCRAPYGQHQPQERCGCPWQIGSSHALLGAAPQEPEFRPPAPTRGDSRRFILAGGEDQSMNFAPHRCPARLGSAAHLETEPQSSLSLARQPSPTPSGGRNSRQALCGSRSDREREGRSERGGESLSPPRPRERLEPPPPGRRGERASAVAVAAAAAAAAAAATVGARCRPRPARLNFGPGEPPPPPPEPRTGVSGATAAARPGPAAARAPPGPRHT
ncbi:basic proline-rich protein-like [Puma concolor]|uniref:Basic proline-rich protein-like n=1 Tax=Puma concolor TaxID=9696 RepID=A0A6P6IQD4_PUMCO|nr:basic proline-rich protein-like [Puma concolor]